ncbi:MAG: LysR family transcriptional regulator [Burkholderiales bacterium]|nr:LysR family transcriptional regulator [Burkholderiales bacterium]MDE1926789.1 LysR family transcriptional regulator [Burkholderiales bacterium]MDE2161002.1 LysR family transcriptional regulator [Burkholderiales bacterium]MDE2454018.1 LysR family transcriptional regulator [Burkholderiales bacterium]
MARLQRLPPIHALSAFESAARLGGFGQAAAELCITPSAVSHRIRQLENQRGEALFDRLPGGVRLTEAGRRYLDGVRAAFDKLALLGSGGAPERPRLAVGVPPTFARNLLIPALPDFYRDWPEVEIEVAVAAPLQERPERHDVDIRYGVPPFDDRPALRLWADRIAAYAAPSYRDAHGLLRAADLDRVERLRSPLVAWRGWCAAAGIEAVEPARGPSFADLGILLEAAASGLGVALAPRRIAVRWTAAGQLVALFDIDVAAPSNYHLLVERDALQRPEVAAFVDWLRALCAAAEACA